MHSHGEYAPCCSYSLWFCSGAVVMARGSHALLCLHCSFDALDTLRQNPKQENKDRLLCNPGVRTV